MEPKHCKVFLEISCAVPSQSSSRLPRFIKQRQLISTESLQGDGLCSAHIVCDRHRMARPNNFPHAFIFLTAVS
jgi:hypothetical protein